MMFRVILCIQFYRFDATYFSTLLKTIASADVVNIANLKNQIVVKNSDGKVLFEKGKVTKFATETYDPTTDNFDFTFLK